MTVFGLFPEKQQDFFLLKARERQRQGSVGDCRHWIIIYLEILDNHCVQASIKLLRMP